jgi:hypothetical protein
MRSGPAKHLQEYGLRQVIAVMRRHQCIAGPNDCLQEPITVPTRPGFNTLTGRWSLLYLHHRGGDAKPRRGGQAQLSPVLAVIVKAMINVDRNEAATIGTQMSCRGME